MSVSRRPAHPVDPNHARGFGLIELMIAMLLSLLILAGVIAIFSSSRASYETTDKISRIQENGRFALDQQAHDVRSAGYVGCSRSPTNLSTSLNNATTLQWNYTAGPISGYQYISAGSWSPALDASVSLPADGSDVLALHLPRRDATPLRLQSDMANGTANIVVPDVAGAFGVGDIAVVYSCESRAFFQVTSFGGGIIGHAQGGATGTTPGNANGDVSYPFRTTAEVLPMETVIYYISASGSGVANATSLWRRTDLKPAEELVEGVEQMQIEYGRDTDGDKTIDDYVNADAVTDWTRIYGVRISLLVRSLDEYGTDKDTRTYTLLAGSVNNSVQVVSPNDRRMREVFTTTVTLRNRSVIVN